MSIGNKDLSFSNAAYMDDRAKYEKLIGRENFERL